MTYSFLCTIDGRVTDIAALTKLFDMAVDFERMQLKTELWNMVTERKGSHAAQYRASIRRFASQSDSNADYMQFVPQLLTLLRLRTSVDDSVRVPPADIEQVRLWLLAHEVMLLAVLPKVEPSEAKQKDHFLARCLASRVLGSWTGTTLKVVRVGKAKLLHWEVRAEFKVVAQAVGLGAPVMCGGCGEQFNNEHACAK
jgi:hypothetical protein